MPPRIQQPPPSAQVPPSLSLGVPAPIVEPLPAATNSPLTPFEPAGNNTGDPRPSGSSPAGSDWSTAVGQYADSLKRLESAVGIVQGTLAAMPDNSAAIKELIESQRKIDKQIAAASQVQDRIYAGVNGVQAQADRLSSQTINETKSATTSLAERLTQQITESKSVTKEVIKELASAIPAAAPWWQLPAQAIGLTGPFGAAAVVITWLLAKRASRSGKTSGGTGSGATEVAPHPFRHTAAGDPAPSHNASDNAGAGDRE